MAEYDVLKNKETIIIGDKLVEVCSDLTDYTVPAGIKEIGRDAFRNTNIKRVIVSEGVEKIGICAFMNTHLEYISLPESLKVIEAYAFDGCEDLSELVIPKSVYRIGDNAFENLPNCVLTFLSEEDDEEELNISAWAFSMRENYCVKEVKAPFGSVAYRLALKCNLNVTKLPGNPSKYTIVDDAFCCVDNVLVEYFGQHKELVVPEVIEEIGENAFNSAKFEKVYLSESVKRISEFAFGYCKNLVEVVGKGVEMIAFNAFDDCKNLQRVEFPNLEIFIEESFSGCDKLERENIVVPEDAFLFSDDMFEDEFEDDFENDKLYYFSQDFVAGLKTKSEGFQNKFYEIIDAICRYLDDATEEKEFQEFIEENHSFSKPGNILYSTMQVYGGRYTEAEFEKFREKIHHFILGLFDDYSASDALTEVPHIIVCVSAPDGCFGDDEISFLEKIFSFERICRGYNPVHVTVVSNDTSNGRGNSCYVVAMK